MWRMQNVDWDWIDDTIFAEEFRPRRDRQGKAEAQPAADEDSEYMEEPELIEAPLIPVRDTVIYPHMVAPLFIGRERSLRALEAAVAGDGVVIVATQRDPDEEEPSPEGLYDIGTEVVIGRTLRMPDGTTNVLGQGQRRVHIVEVIHTTPYIRVRAAPIEEPEVSGVATEALMRAVLALFEKIVQLSPSLPEDAYVAAMNVDDPGWLADLIASMMEFDVETRQAILEEINPAERLQRLSILLAKELDVLELENEIQSQVQQEMDRSQREYFLREQMRIIQNELGELDSQQQEIEELRAKLEEKQLPEEVRSRAEKELERLAAMPAAAPEVGIIRTYLDWILELPWTEETPDNMDLENAERILESEHYGLTRAKERILEHIAVRKLAGSKMRSPILCFVGPPGTGKTSMGRSIAKALGRNFVRVSVGGIRDEAEIRGHRRTYIGALPGRIIQTMRRAKSINPLFMLDEIDKLGTDFRGDPAAALLEVLDPEQNYAFSDHYLEVPYDLSKVFFITTANTLYTIPPALQDRMEVIEFPGYVEEEKLEIARHFLIPRQIELHGLNGHPVQFSDTTLRTIIREYTYEAGVRNLEREIAQICRKLARRVAQGEPAPHRITVKSLPQFLGPPEFTSSRVEEEDQVGLATGIAWTEAGGDIMPIEVLIMEGKGNLLLTGQLGEVMQESAQAALSFARANAERFGFKDVDFDKIDIHVHIPEGAIPKDGPSGGIAIATAMISALSGRPVRRDVGMTGEITLRGRVLPIGGVKEKILAAHRAGLKTVLLPKKNEKDLIEVPRKLRKGLRVVFVSHMDEVLKEALLDQHVSTAPKKRVSRRKKAA